jgi:nitrogen fixation NifU-like protein
MYSQKVLKHFQNPHNYGEMKNPDGVGRVGNLVCGDVMWVYVKIGKNKKKEEYIKDIKFKTYGCTAAIATSSMVTDLVKGKTIQKALSVSKNEIIDSLDGLPPIKIHCSILATEALNEAIYDYLKKQKREIPSAILAKHKTSEKEQEILDKKHKNCRS